MFYRALNLLFQIMPDRGVHLFVVLCAYKFSAAAEPTSFLNLDKVCKEMSDTGVTSYNGVYYSTVHSKGCASNLSGSV